MRLGTMVAYHAQNTSKYLIRLYPKACNTMTTDTTKAHRFCTANYTQLKASSKCGCFYCEQIYDPKEIVEWIEDRDGLTALCPYCGIDAVLAESARYPITKEFLTDMHEHWF